MNFGAIIVKSKVVDVRSLRDIMYAYARMYIYVSSYRYDYVVVGQFLTILTQRACNARIWFPFAVGTPRSSRCVSHYVRRKTRRARARARICAPCDKRTFQNDAFSACTFRYFLRQHIRTSGPSRFLLFEGSFPSLYITIKNYPDYEISACITFVALNESITLLLNDIRWILPYNRRT